MQVSIDRAGRVVVPKPLRDELGLAPGTALDIDVVDGHLELSPPRHSPTIADGPHGPVLARTGTPISDEEVRAALEASRARR
ncbi:MAG TPA: AbrB/MazE/SpoVT family DNA-binding domain-containing protein [Solirubrobacteraceae bacterium]|nr:AbrB/MazE/SpoVT family DNA-binding domain-containing protein [Solirubrobacteraceae bacterium]